MYLCRHESRAPHVPSAAKRTISLSALRGFEASARRDVSFTLAAAELNLTQSSISWQVAELERQGRDGNYLHGKRDRWRNRGGHRLFQAAQQAHQTDRPCRRRHPADSRNAARVTITTYASSPALLVVPRLAKFQRETSAD
jgi:LysR family glycine cleavage system transcriptional activator